MRLLIVCAIIGSIIYAVYHTFSTGQGFFSKAIEDPMAQAMSKPTSFFRPKDSPGASPGPPPGAPPGSATDPLNSAPVPTPQPQPTQTAPLPAPLPESTSVYRFSDRVPPDLSQSLASHGVASSVDLDSRSVTLRGLPENVANAMGALEFLDLVPGSCSVHTWAVYVDRTQQKGWDLTAAIKAIGSVDLGATVRPGQIAINLSSDEISSALNVIADGSAVDVLQRPHLTLLHGQPAIVESTSDVPLQTVSVTGTGLSQSGVTYRKVGLVLKVVPYFLGRDRVRLQVDQENGLIGSTVSLGNGLTAPIIETQKVSSSVELSIGQAIVLGGVATERLIAKKGLLRDATEKRQGALYVILATSPDAPRAIPVDAWERSQPFQSLPFGLPIPDAETAVDDQISLLPPIGWEREEKRFLRSRAAK